MKYVLILTFIRNIIAVKINYINEYSILEEHHMNKVYVLKKNRTERDQDVSEKRKIKKRFIIDEIKFDL